ncbi:MAG: hypothetical protein GXO47_01895 [Chlorobi bacterium]|nr:hypothetical protein [Chlorobiota bacterium]
MIKHTIHFLIVVSVLLSSGCTSGIQSNDYTKKLNDTVRAEQIKDLKFGMFVCWSFCSL